MKALNKFHWFLLLCLSALAALLGTSQSAHREVYPRNGWEVFDGISPADGWIEDGATISLPGLLERGNRMRIALKGWRPEGLAPAHLRISVCGELVQDRIVAEPVELLVYLSGACEPRTVTFEVVNPFQASAGDTRAKGTQLEKIEVFSALGAPIVRVEYVGLATLLIFLLTALVAQVLAPWAALSYLVPPLAFELLRNARYVNYEKALLLWVFVAALLLGVGIARRLQLAWQSQREDLPAERGAGSAYVLLAVCAVVAGGALRFYGLTFGLPSNFHPDEVPKVNAVMRMYDSGTLNPRYFLHPSLLLYSTYAMNSLFHSVGMSGDFRETAFLAGRTVSALAGTLSILLTYLIGQRLWSRRCGALAASLLAVLPLHVTSTRYLKEDALLTFFILLCAVFTLIAVERNRKWLLLIAGFAGGLAFSTKYSGLLCVCIVGAAPWLRSKRFVPASDWLLMTALACLFVPLGFLLGTPYALLDSKKFLRDFNHERSHMSRGHTLSIDAWSQYWMYHFGRSIAPGMSWFAAVLSTVGIGLLIVRRRISDLYLIALVLLFYLPAEFVKAKPAPQPERYIFPCLPFLAIAAGTVLDALLRAPSSGFAGLRRAVPIMFALAMLLPLSRSLNLASELHHDTRDRMESWIRTHIAPGAKIAVDWKPYQPTLDGAGFEIEYLPRDKIALFLREERLEELGVDYLMLSSLWYDRYFSQPRSDVTVRRRIEAIFNDLPVVQEYAPRHGTYGFHNPKLTLFAVGQGARASLQGPPS